MGRRFRAGQAYGGRHCGRGRRMDDGARGRAPQRHVADLVARRHSRVRRSSVAQTGLRASRRASRGARAPGERVMQERLFYLALVQSADRTFTPPLYPPRCAQPHPVAGLQIDQQIRGSGSSSSSSRKRSPPSGVSRMTRVSVVVMRPARAASGAQLSGPERSACPPRAVPQGPVRTPRARGDRAPRPSAIR